MLAIPLSNKTYVNHCFHQLFGIVQAGELKRNQQNSWNQRKEGNYSSGNPDPITCEFLTYDLDQSSSSILVKRYESN